MEIRPAKCERTAQFVSLGLDDELSRFERAILRDHLRRCPSCAELARRTTSATALLRAAPLEPIRLTLPARGRPRTRHAAPAAAAMATAALGFAALWVGLLRGGPHDTGALHAPKLRPAVLNLANERFDWPAGVPHGEQLVQFVPGGRFTFTA